MIANGEWIGSTRENRGMTIETLSEVSGIKKYRIEKFERNELIASPSEIEQIYTALDERPPKAKDGLICDSLAIDFRFPGIKETAPCRLLFENEKEYSCVILKCVDLKIDEPAPRTYLTAMNSTIGEAREWEQAQKHKPSRE